MGDRKAMRIQKNRRVVLTKRPEGMPSADCFELKEEPIRALAPSEVLVEITHLSIDPAMRAWVDEDSYMGPVQIGETMRALGVGRVVQSEYPRLAHGDLSMLQKHYAVLVGSASEEAAEKIEKAFAPGARQSSEDERGEALPFPPLRKA